MLNANRRKGAGEGWLREKRASLILTLSIDPFEIEHEQFFQIDDRAQSLYERLRRAALDQRHRVDRGLKAKVEAHGVAGLFIDPEHTIVGYRQTLRPRVSDRNGTALFHAHLSDEEFETIATSLAEGVGLRTTARIQRVDKKTALLVLSKAARQATKVTRALLASMTVTECQLDEMWSFVGKKEKNLNPIEKLGRTLGDAWIWIAFDAVNKVVLAKVVGKRTLPHAVELLEEVKRVTTVMPELFSSDQLDQYQKALLQVYGKVVQPRRTGKRGRPSKPRFVAPDDLLYVQVVKQYEKYRISKVSRRIVFGTQEQVDRILASSPSSHKINTSHIERNNGSIRHIDSRCVRKTYGFSKIMTNHKRQLELSLAYYHLCRSHLTLTKRHGKPTTPFMSAGLTDHVWTMKELLSFKCEIPAP